ncbi:MAG TPA: Wzz/FepE/Etk N-terminal domain-containing protein [Gemmatimonadales bacterium]|nr:Wzz/FepE/Etk N-terminal domain-containing protein [Gemmatimonadales bacterium]
MRPDAESKPVSVARPTGGPRRAQPEHTGEVSLIGIAAMLLRQRRAIALCVVLGGALALAVGLLRPRTYTATAAFLPGGETDRFSALQGLAAQFNLQQLIGGSSQATPDFYVALLTSRDILGAVVDSGVEVKGKRVFLADYLKVNAPTPAIRRERAIERLERTIGANADTRTGMVNLSVKLKSSPLAGATARRLLDLLNEFNLRTRQSQARAERLFVESRLREVNADLRAAEDELQAFFQQNRDYRNSPALAFQQERLQRVVSLRQQVATTLAQAYEQSRIDEVRDTPVISVIEPPADPAEPDRRRLLVRIIVGVILGGLIGLLAAAALEFMGQSRAEGGDEFADFVRLRREALSDLRRPWRILGIRGRETTR